MAGLRKPVDWEGHTKRLPCRHQIAAHVGIRVRDLACIDQEACGQGGLEQGIWWKGSKWPRKRCLTGPWLTAWLTAKGKFQKTLIEVAAETQKNIILEHRRVIGRIRVLFISLLAELEALTNHKHVFEELGEVTNKGDLSQDRGNQLYNRVIELPMRIASMKKLVEILKMLIGLEREAFGIDGKTEVDGPANSNITISFVSARAKLVNPACCSVNFTSKSDKCGLLFLGTRL